VNLDIFLKELCEEGSMWDLIINNIIAKGESKLSDGTIKLKRALVSEIAISYLERKNKINSMIGKPDFKYYFIQTVINQVKSSSSPLYKNYRKTLADSGEEFDFTALDIPDENDRDKKIDFELKINDIKNKLLKIKISWFEGQMFKLYYEDGLTYRQIEKEWGINFLTAYSAVKRVKEKLIKLND
jgi:hypothetical protein